MAIVINGDGSISGISVGGLPDGIVDSGTLATDSVDSAELINGAVDDSHLATGIDAIKLADGTITNSELQYINSLSSNAQTQISAAGGGKLLQCLSTTLTTVVTSTTTGSFTDIAGLSVAITPASGTKVLVLGMLSWNRSAGSYVSGWRMVRDSTAIGVATSTSNRQAYSGPSMNETNQTFTLLSSTAVHLDTHGADGSTELTYKIQFMNHAGTIYINRSNRDDDASTHDGRAISSITVMEIAA